MKSALVRSIVLALIAVFTLSCGGGGGGDGGGSSSSSGGGATIIGYVYSLNNVAKTVSVYRLYSTGLLALASTANTGTNPCTITIDPSGKFAYVTNTDDLTISQYTIGANGALTDNGTTTITTGFGPNSLTVDPGGKYAYVTNYAGMLAGQDGTVSKFTIGADGKLSGEATVTYAGANPWFVAIRPSGDYAYVIDHDAALVLLYNINLVNGSLTAAGVPIVTGTGPSMMAIDPTGVYAYVSNFDTTTISQYTINAADGALTSNGTVNPGNNPFSVTIDPTGKYVYASNFDDGATDTTISQYTIGAGGALTAMVPATVAAGKGPTYLVIDPSGKYAFVGNVGSNNISMYTITTGKLAANSPATIGPSTTPVWMAIKGP
jgi:DNA-binding beta-propeller fold protein YncE